MFTRRHGRTWHHGSPTTGNACEDVGFMTCMTLVLLGNYAQTGHFGGPLAYTPFNVATHLAGPELRRPALRLPAPQASLQRQVHARRRPLRADLLRAVDDHGRGARTRKYQATGDRRYYVAPDVAMLPVDALGFRRGAGALKTLLADQGLADHPLFAQAKGRGIRALSGHIESTDVTNDVNGGPSGVGIATAAGKAAFWDIVGAPMGSPKIIAFEGEFAMCAGHAQELKTQAIALQVGKRLRDLLLRQQRRHRRCAASAAWCTASSTATGWSISGRRTAGTSSRCRTATTTTRSSAC